MAKVDPGALRLDDWGQWAANAQAYIFESGLAGEEPGWGGTLLVAHVLWPEWAELPVSVALSVPARGVGSIPVSPRASSGRPFSKDFVSKAQKFVTQDDEC
ncbi:short coiled-coil protein isoform X3 [Saimiri boliviensis]|uniref:short coiled-coil protein isoform X3 n=1 Tax=Saimiri boliviensis TaxID=27679 RepID=UPI003D775AB8